MAAKLPFYLVGGACVLGLAGVAYLEFAPERTAKDLPLSAEGKAYIHDNHLALSDVTMKATGNYALQTLVEIEGKIANTGDRPVDIVEVYCVFSDAYGQMMYRPRVAIVNTRMGGLKPGETKSFRLPFDEIPDSWNQKMPQLVIAAVKFS